jgi:hypothetical protein
MPHLREIFMAWQSQTGTNPRFATRLHPIRLKELVLAECAANTVKATCSRHAHISPPHVPAGHLAPVLFFHFQPILIAK